MNPYRILKTDNGYEIVRVSYDEDGRPKSFGPLDFVSADTREGIKHQVECLWMSDEGSALTYSDFQRGA